MKKKTRISDTTSSPAVPPRNQTIDQFRGLSIVMMVVANYMEHIEIVPGWLKHAPDIGLTVIDFIAPFFIFAIGLTYAGSFFRRKERAGLQKALEHTLTRALALVGIGSLFSIGEIVFGFNSSGFPWGTLQAIGLAIIIALPFLFLHPPMRFIAGLFLAAAYQALLDSFLLETVLRSPHAGLPGAFSWGALLILATVFADLYSSDEVRRYIVLAVSVLAAGILLSLFIPVSKHRMTMSFDLIVTGTGALVFFLFDILSRRTRIPFRMLETWGMNPLVLYVIHLFLLAVFLVPGVSWWHVRAPVWLVILQGASFLVAIHLLARTLRLKGIVVSL